jgi:hypothetical protein
MSYTKQQLVEILTPALVKSTASTPKEIRDVLATYTVEGLNLELARQRRLGYLQTPQVQPRQTQPQAVVAKHHQQPQIMGDQVLEDLAWTHISRVIVDGKMPVTNAANRQIVFSWLHEDQGEQPTVEWFKKVLTEPGLANQISWEPVLSPEQRKQEAAAKEARAREVFQVVCRKNNLSLCEANFRVLFDSDLLGSVYTADQGITSNAVSLVSASAEEFARFQQERVESHNDTIQRMDTVQLKARVREEAEARQQATKQDQAARELEAAKQRDELRGYRPLPPEIDGKAIKQASGQQLKQWIRLYGSYQITNAVRVTNLRRIKWHEHQSQ